MLAGLLALSFPATASAAGPPCETGISRDTSERVFALLNHPLAEAACRFEGVNTAGDTLEARWSLHGTPLPPLRVVPRECAPGARAHAGRFAVDVPTDIAQSCPSVGPLLAEFMKQLATETPAGGSLADPLFRAARGLFMCLAIMACGLLLRGATRLRALDPRWIVVGITAGSAALAVRTALPFSLGNWYTEVLPASGAPPWMRFGPGVFAFQSLLRDLGVWNPFALIFSQLLLGAAAIPLLLGVLWELDVELAAAAATLVLFVVAPFHARLSATASEHVLASTLTVALLLSWLRAARTGDALWLALSVVLFPIICLTRVDMAAQATAVLLWPLLRDRNERHNRRRDTRGLWQAALLAAVATSTLAATYYFVALPSRHPLPERAAQLYVLRAFLSEHWILATRAPGWISFAAVGLAMIGGVTMVARRPWLLVRVGFTLVVAFGTLGRSFIPDELVGARYFLFTIPIFLIVSGQGFDALLRIVPLRFRRAAAAAGVVILGIWSGVAARTAYTTRYAFEDEYSFARTALALLPSGCTVYEVPVRSAALHRDLDCCLDLPRSPLVLDFPRLTFSYLPAAAAAVFETPGCVAYYESIACAIADDPNDPVVHDRTREAAPFFEERCAEARRVGRLEPVAETTTSPRATVDFFRTKRPRAGVYRWTPVIRTRD